MSYDGWVTHLSLIIWRYVYKSITLWFFFKYLRQVIIRSKQINLSNSLFSKPCSPAQLTQKFPLFHLFSSKIVQNVKYASKRIMQLILEQFWHFVLYTFKEFLISIKHQPDDIVSSFPLHLSQNYRSAVKKKLNPPNAIVSRLSGLLNTLSTACFRPISRRISN